LKPQHDVIVAIDGASALKAAQKHEPDIILLDIIMPDMSGFDVIVKLKEAEATKNIPVIFISALDNTGDAEKGLALGAVDFITKPFNESVVREKIKTHLKMP
jgi:DNA-binding response OmpR family regulator